MGKLDVWGRVVRDPYMLLLSAAAAVQVMLGSSEREVNHPGWAFAALGLFVLACVSALFARLRSNRVLATVAPFVLIVVACFWRAADRSDVGGFGGLCLIAVIWLGFYGTRQQTWLAVAATFPAVVSGPLLVGEAITADDLRRGVLAGAVALLIGPTIAGLAHRNAQSAERVSALEPASLRLDAVLRAATGNLIVTCDPNGVIAVFNQGAERLLGYRADEVVGTRTLLSFHDPDEVAARARELGVPVGPAALFDAALRNEVEIRDWTYLTRDGRRITVSLSLTCMRDASGSVTGYVCIGTDVTASRATIRTLAGQREIYQMLVEHVPLTTVGLFDADLRCVTIGGHWLHKIGADSASLRGTRIDEFFSAGDRERALEVYERGRTEPVTAQWELVDGHIYEFNVLPVRGPEGQTLVMSLARDVTAVQRQRQETDRVNAALAVSEASFRQAFEGAPIGMALTSYQDGPEEKFLRVNAAFAAILGRRPADFVGKPVADFTHPEDVALQPELTASGPAHPLRKRFMRPSGRSVWVDVNYAVVRDADGAPSHIIKQIQDVHTIKESERALFDALEQQRAATARLRELDRIRTDLVGTISHELRTPLTSIHGYLELLADEQLSEGQHAMLDVALRNTERLADLVDKLLVLVRLDSLDETVPAGSDDVDIPSAVSAAIDTVRPEFVDRDQALRVNLPIERAVVRGDFEQIDRVLVNLLSNASKYTPAGGQVDVDVAMVNGAVRLAITDSGIGIPPEELPHLFTRFFRASTARANAISGNGLGLAIVKSIVERHGGEVSVESEPGVGSRFAVTLPALTRVPVEAADDARTVA